MKPIEWGKWSAIAEILSAIAIVITLLYLSVQTRYLALQTEQNNELLAAEASTRFVEQRAGALARWADDTGGMMALRLKASQGEPLTQEEQWRIESEAGFVFVQLEWEYQQYAAGRTPYVPTEAYRAILTRWPFLVTLWETKLHSRYSAEFERFMDEQLALRAGEGE